MPELYCQREQDVLRLEPNAYQPISVPRKRSLEAVWGNSLGSEDVPLDTEESRRLAGRDPGICHHAVPFYLLSEIVRDLPLLRL